MSYYMDFEITMALLVLGIGLLVFIVPRWIDRQYLHAAGNKSIP